MPRATTLHRTLRHATALWLAIALGACTSLGEYRNASFNEPLKAPPAVAGDATAITDLPRHTFKVDGSRGNKKVLMFLSLSGGGSRAAYLSASTMLALQAMREQIGADLLAEVDVMSSVSGGSIAAAYYVASRDAALGDAALLARVRPLTTLQPKLSLKADGRLVCSGALTTEETAQLRAVMTGDPADVSADLRQLTQLCLSASFPEWSADATLPAMRADYLTKWIGNWFWPSNIFSYWTSSFDRSDIMAETLAGNLYSRRGLLGQPLLLSDLNPTRPFLLINATNASSQVVDGEVLDEFPFGSVFTFTQEDFRDRLASDADRYSLARAVMGSSAFPLVFASMTLQDFRPPAAPRCATPESTATGACHVERYLHIFDGGNSDNLGLRSVKRTLLQMEADDVLKDYDRILVLMVDAFTTPRGAPRDKPDPRSLLSLLIDTNVSDAVDSLLQTNRDRLLGEFDDGQLGWSRDCAVADNGLRQLPRSLCDRLTRLRSERVKTFDLDREGRPLRGIDLGSRMVFYHFGFEDVERFAATPEAGRALKKKLDLIPTSFRIGQGDTLLIDEAVRLVISPRNPCLRAMARLASQVEAATPDDVDQARRDCRRSEAGRKIAPQPAPGD